MKELQGWDLVSVVHVIGDRRDHFEAINDVQEIFNRVVEQRRRREIDPTLTLLRDLSMKAENDADIDSQTRQRIVDMLEFLEVMTNWYDTISQLPNATLMKLVKLGDKVVKLVSFKI